MNWNAVGAIAELLGAMGVIATLVYLARQINQNTLTVRSSALSAYSQLTLEFNALLCADPELNNLFWTVLSDRESLSREDQRRADSTISSYLIVMEQAHDLYREGALSGEKWVGRRAQLHWLVTQPGFAAYWKTFGPQYARAFASAVESELPVQIAPAAQQDDEVVR